MSEKMVLPREMMDSLRELLPEHLSATLRAELKKGQEAREEVLALIGTVEKLDAQIKQHQKLNTREKHVSEREAKCAEREKVVTEDEMRQEVFELQATLKAEQRVSDKLEKALAGLVRNTEWREDIWRTTSYGSDGSCHELPSGSTKKAG